MEHSCSHYKANVKLATPCCDKVYSCRYCHNESESHTLNVDEITELVCSNCSTRQGLRARCENCHMHFGIYVCLFCKIFDNESKGQFHCEGCGLCRVGGRHKYFHCIKCNVCLPLSMQNNHKCIENVSRSACPICLEDIHTSCLTSRIADCGHFMHRECFWNYAKCGNYACPFCQKSMLDVTGLWKIYDQEVENLPMPESLQHDVKISCNDCNRESIAKYSLVGRKCPHCGSYNTREI